MKIECSHCNKVYNMPDERLPDKDRIVFPRPACKAIITVDRKPKPTHGTTITPVEPSKEIISGYHLRKNTQDGEICLLCPTPY